MDPFLGSRVWQHSQDFDKHLVWLVVGLDFEASSWACKHSGWCSKAMTKSKLLSWTGCKTQTRNLD